MNDEVDYYALAEQHPDKYRVLKNGAVLGVDERHIVAMDNSRNPHAITVENSQEMHKLRRAQAQSSILQGIADGANVDLWSDGVRNMSAALTQMVLKQHSKASDQFMALMRAADLVDSGRPGTQQPVNANAARIELGAEVVGKLLDLVRTAIDASPGDDDDVVDV